MKRILLFLLMVAATASSLQSQTFEEWFAQKKTQKKYLLQQMAALQVYIGYAKKGYNIAKNGLNTIGGFTRGEFNLHMDYFNSLKSVNPKIKHYAKVAAITSLQVKIVKSYYRTYTQIKESDAFSADEVAYIGRVFNRLLEDGDKALDELINITTDGTLDMKDDERMERMDKLYREMQDKYSFSQHFSNDAKSLAVARLKEKADVQTSRTRWGIKK